MPRRRKYAVWLSEMALRDACEAMEEYVKVQHDRARTIEHGRKPDKPATRGEADRMAASANELHDALTQLLLEAGKRAN
jgi:hypothetical protein